MSVSATSHTRRIATLVAIGGCVLGLSAPAVAGARKGGSGKSGAAQKQAPVAQPLALAIAVKLVPGKGAALHYKGTFTGAPLGHGEVVLTSKLAGASVTVSYQLITAAGTITGTGTCGLTYGGTTITYNGAALITKGTGAYKKIRTAGLQISGTAQASTTATTLQLTGTVTY